MKNAEDSNIVTMYVIESNDTPHRKGVKAK
jgi:hypothetical protein